MQNPVIVVPGIQGSGLADYYPVPSEELWSAVLRKAYERIALHPDNRSFEAVEPARVLPTGPLPLAYQDLIEALRHDLSTSAEPTPVFPFGYDWRRDCQQSADLLAAFVEEVLARSWLLPHYRNKNDRRVDLVGHSMGGLIIADYLSRHGAEKVRRVATLATPFEGSHEAIKKLCTGLGNFTDTPPRDRDREAARTIPSLYQLLPTYAGAVQSAEGLPTDLYQIPTWQPSILKTLGAYIKAQQAVIDPDELFQSYLDGLRRLRESVAGLAKKPVPPWLAIAGLGTDTQTKTNIIWWPSKGKNRQPCFDFPALENDYPGEAGGATGDGTVPFPGACPPFLSTDQLLCVSPEDFGVLELKVRILAKAAGFHAFVPAVNLVQRLVIKFLRPSFDGDVWGRAAPGVQTPRWPVAARRLDEQ